MEEKNKVENIENNVLNEEAVLKKEEKKVKEISKELSEGKKPANSNSFKDKAINWLKEPSNLALVAVMIFAIGIRFYYFWITKNQPLWWDELCYGSIAKNFVTHVWDGTPLILTETHIRPIIFSILWAILLKINLSEVIIRFLLVLIPSCISLFLVYLIGKEIYGKKIGIFALAIFSVIWLNLFYNSRLLVHMLEMDFFMASLYFFIKSINKEEFSYKNFIFSLIFLSLATLTRYQDGIAFIVYFIVLIISNNLYLNKIKFWYSGIMGVFPLILFFIINFIIYGNIFPALFAGDYVTVASSEVPLAFNLLSFIPNFLTIPFFILFLIGLVYLLFEIILSYNLLSKDSIRRNGLILILILIIFFSFFIFVLRSAEDRYFFETLASLSIISAFGLSVILKYLKPYGKLISIIFILIIFLAGGYYELKQADGIINNKKDSFLQIKQAFEWIKANTPQDSVIIGSGIDPYAVYYADRRYLQLSYNESDVSKIDLADYLVAHAFSTQPDYLNKYIQDNQKNLEPVNAFFFDTQKQQPAVIVYKINKNETNGPN